MQETKQAHSECTVYYTGISQGFPGGTGVKNPLPVPETYETQVRSVSWEDHLEQETATHFSILAWKIPRIEELGGLKSMGLQRYLRKPGKENWMIKVDCVFADFLAKF